MSAMTNPSTGNTHEAQFLAPETRQQAGARTKGKGGGPQEAKKLGADTVQPGDMVLIPVSRLVRSPFNVRRTGGEDVTELAALIKAQGVLQNLVVHDVTTKRGALTGDYGVAAGGRRMKALHALVKASDLPHDHEVLCKYVTRAEALASSMAENSGREPMSLPDTVTAFADMVASGAGIEDLAVFFGITPLTVQRRMKLAKVSPKLFGSALRTGTSSIAAGSAPMRRSWDSHGSSRA
jgi:ParB-like chromosome segregation protein Spo0J